MTAREIDALYGLPLEEFTAARNALAKRDPEAQKLAKPTVPAWAVNQLARRHRDLVRRLVANGEKLRRAQERALGSRGQAASLGEGRAAERTAIAELTRKAASVLEESGRNATRPMLDRIAATLAAGVQTAEGRAALVAGRLTEELEPAGFGALAGIEPAPAAKSRPSRAERRAEDERRARIRKARADAKELDVRARAAEREADRVEAAAAKARAVAEKARRKADAALADLA